MKFKNYLPHTLILFFLCITMVQTGISQSLIEVTVQNNVFVPASISINVGDTVKWTNIEGTHNVNGTTSTFPSNPESFGNAVAGAPWVFTHVFNTAGFYDYQCDVHVALGMVGDVTVSASTAISDPIVESNMVDVYPVPATDQVTLRFSAELLSNYPDISLVIFDMTGREINRIQHITEINSQIETANWATGSYIIKLFSNGELLESNKLVVN